MADDGFLGLVQLRQRPAKRRVVEDRVVAETARSSRRLGQLPLDRAPRLEDDALAVCDSERADEPRRAARAARGRAGVRRSTRTYPGMLRPPARRIARNARLARRPAHRPPGRSLPRSRTFPRRASSIEPCRARSRRRSRRAPRVRSRPGTRPEPPARQASPRVSRESRAACSGSWWRPGLARPGLRRADPARSAEWRSGG